MSDNKNLFQIGVTDAPKMPETVAEAKRRIGNLKSMLVKSQKRQKLLGCIIEVPFKIERLEEEGRPEEIAVDEWVQKPRDEKWVTIVTTEDEKGLFLLIESLLKVSNDSNHLSKLIVELYDTLIDYKTYFRKHRTLPDNLFEKEELESLAQCFINTSVM